MVTLVLGQLWWIAAVAAGALCGLAGWLVLTGARQRPVRLGDALDHLDPAAHALPELSSGADRGDAIGAWVGRHWRVRVGRSTQRTLTLLDRSLTDFLAEKAIMALIGVAAPLLFTGLSAALGVGVGWTPLGLALLLGLIGWFIPDLRLRSATRRTRSDAGEALCTFVDLVTLERLANQSSTAALHSAAAVADSPLFVHLRRALERARLEQRPAWQALRQVGAELDLPQLIEVADVIRLDEQGAALSSVLRARSAELRNAQLAADRTAAQNASESLTVWMVIPAMIFALIFLVPPLLRLTGAAP